MLGPGREMQQCFRQRGPIGFTRKQQASQEFRSWCTAGFARKKHSQAVLFQGFDKQVRLGRFAGSLTAFKGDQSPYPQMIGLDQLPMT
jgi:hypothetical protein